MLTNVISSFASKKFMVLELISWKHSFKRLNEEYEIAKKKKQALDNLFETGKISQSTHDSFNGEIAAAIAEIEKQQTALLDKMQLKAKELEGQIKTLEMLLANYEIQHVAGEIDEEIYQREMNLLSMGLETIKQELDVIKEAANQICQPAPVTVTPPSPPQESEIIQNPPAEEAPTASAEVEAAPEPRSQEPATTVEETISEPIAVAEETVQEPAQTAEETVSEPVITVEAETVPEPAVVVEEPVSESVAPAEETIVEPVATVEETSAEPSATVEEAIVEPVITVEEAVSEPEQTSAETTESALTETEPVEEATQEAPLEEAHPQKAPQEAHQESVLEPVAEVQCAEETVAEEAAAESDESQEEEV